MSHKHVEIKLGGIENVQDFVLDKELEFSAVQEMRKDLIDTTQLPWIPLGGGQKISSDMFRDGTVSKQKLLELERSLPPNYDLHIDIHFFEDGNCRIRKSCTLDPFSREYALQHEI